jgi:hypothetical protein
MNHHDGVVLSARRERLILSIRRFRWASRLVGTGLEAQIAIGALLQRFPNIRLIDANPRFGDNIILRGVGALPIGF